MLEKKTPVPPGAESGDKDEISPGRSPEAEAAAAGRYVPVTECSSPSEYADGVPRVHEAFPAHARKKAARKGFRTVFLIALCGGTLAEAVLFMQRQLNEISGLLREDFRIIFVADRKISRDQSRVMEEKIRTLAGVSGVYFVNREDRLKRLEISDPDMVQSVVLLGENPVPDSFEVTIDESSLGDIPSVIDSAKNIPGIADAKYKPVQAYAMLQVLFYERFLRFSLSAAALFLVFLGIMTAFYRLHWSRLLQEIGGNIRWVAAGAAGALLSVGLCLALVYPVKFLSPLWAWPRWPWHAAVIFLGGFTGWILFQWKNTR